VRRAVVERLHAPPPDAGWVAVSPIPRAVRDARLVVVPANFTAAPTPLPTGTRSARFAGWWR
jgi:hypothetical protein